MNTSGKEEELHGVGAEGEAGLASFEGGRKGVFAGKH